MPTSSELAFRTKRYVPDTQDEGDTTGRRDASIVAALSEMARDRPNVLAASVTAGDVAVSEIAGWDASWSEVKESYWPVFSTDNPAIEDEPAKVLVEANADGEDHLRFPGAFPSSTQPALIRFTARWTVATLPEAYEEALVLLASSMYARALAGVKSNRVRVLPGGARYSPRLLGLGGQVSCRTGWLLLPVAVVAAVLWLRPGEDDGDERRTVLALWALGHLVAFTLTDWRQTKHLMNGLLPLVAAALVTVAGTRPGVFTVALIPTTLEETNLKDLENGTRVNLEADLFARYVSRLLEGRPA